jgi:glycolate oxidase FAD binding subunit
MPGVLRPKTEEELADTIARAVVEKQPLEVIGLGTRRGFGKPMQTAATLDLSSFSEVISYEPEELILEAGAATPMSEIEKLLSKHNQHLAFEPSIGGSLGGVLCTNHSGPRRFKTGAARDHILGVRGVSGRGEIFKGGARVVKNVTGYDVPKLMAGSMGTLAALTTVTFKVLPRPETEETAVLTGLNLESAVAAMSAAASSSCEISGAAHLPDGRTVIRLEGIVASVAARRDALLKLLVSFGKIEILNKEGSRKLWMDVRDVTAFRDAAYLWRVSLPPSNAPAYVHEVSSSSKPLSLFDWSGGLVWLAFDGEPHVGAVRGLLKDGHATLVRAPQDVRQRVAVFHPQPPAHAALSKRVKESFDPMGILNPGRMD